jgi:hypothetical protein
MVVDFDESKTRQPEYLTKISKLKRGIQNNYPETLLDQTTARAIYGIGSLCAPSPVAISVQTPSIVKDAVEVMGKKLTHAPYLRETGKRRTASHSFFSSVYQPQLGGTESLTAYFASLLPDKRIGRRTNVKEYGDWFRYMSGFMLDQDFFVYAVQFGHGLILWGIVRGPNVPLPDSQPLKSVPWIRGACRAGSARAIEPNDSSEE